MTQRDKVKKWLTAVGAALEGDDTRIKSNKSTSGGEPPEDVEHIPSAWGTITQVGYSQSEGVGAGLLGERTTGPDFLGSPATLIQQTDAIEEDEGLGASSTAVVEVTTEEEPSVLETVIETVKENPIKTAIGAVVVGAVVKKMI